MPGATIAVAGATFYGLNAAQAGGIPQRVPCAVGKWWTFLATNHRFPRTVVTLVAQAFHHRRRKLTTNSFWSVVLEMKGKHQPRFDR